MEHFLVLRESFSAVSVAEMRSIRGRHQLSGMESNVQPNEISLGVVRISSLNSSGGLKGQTLKFHFKVGWPPLAEQLYLPVKSFLQTASLRVIGSCPNVFAARGLKQIWGATVEVEARGSFHYSGAAKYIYPSD